VAEWSPRRLVGDQRKWGGAATLRHLLEVERTSSFEGHLS